MSNLSTAGSPINDPTLVVPEYLGICVNWDSDWSSVKSCLELLFVVRWDLIIVSNLNSTELRFKTAGGLLFYQVWVISFLFQWVNSDVLKSIIYETTVASEVAPSIIWSTVDKLLWRESHQASSGNIVVGFHSCSSCECPAWSTSFLSNGRCHMATFSPIKLIWQAFSWKSFTRSFDSSLHSMFFVASTRDSTKFFIRPIRHFVDANFESCILFLMIFDKL